MICGGNHLEIMKKDSNHRKDGKPRRAYQKFNPNYRMKELMTLLREQETEIFSNSDDGFDYLDEDCHCIFVSNPSGSNDLYMDLEKDGMTLTIGDWEAHYAPKEEEFRLMKEDLRRILSNQSFIAVVYVKKEWICSLTVPDAEIRDDDLFRKIREFIHSADCDPLIDRIREKGASIRCRYWDQAKNRKITVPAGTF